METVLLIIFVLLSVYLGWRVARQQRALQFLGREWRALQAEEKQVFDFLHGLGEAFGGGTGRRDLHRLIVEGAARILNAHGGALYLVDRSGRFLSPAFISRTCAPLVNVPQHIREQAASNPVALESYLRLHPVHAGDGALALVWKEGGARIFHYSDTELAGLAGDSWSLGFVRETENQVEAHLQEHMERLPQNDARSRAILDQMKTDEAKHAQMAEIAGGRELPQIIRSAMALTSGFMKTLAYRI